MRTAITAQTAPAMTPVLVPLLLPPESDDTAVSTCTCGYIHM